MLLCIVVEGGQLDPGSEIDQCKDYECPEMNVNQPVHEVILSIFSSFFTPHVSDVSGVIFLTSCVRVSVCASGFTQGTLYTTTTVYGALVHQEGAICTTKAQYAPWCTRETMFFEKFRGP